MKVIVAGSRDIVSYRPVKEAYSESAFIASEIVSGGARGVDTSAVTLASHLNVPITFFYAEWDKYGKSAGYKRNQQMAEYADALIAIWDCQSKGTKHMIDIMTKLNKPIEVYKI